MTCEKLQSRPTPERGVARRVVATLAERARRARVAEVRIGLGYTAVGLADGRAGVAYTFREEARGGCSVFRGLRPLAGRPAADLLPLLESGDPIEAAVALACANALADPDAAGCRSGDVLEHLDLRPEDRVGMVGEFGPLLALLRERVRELVVFERLLRPGADLRPAREAARELPRCQVALITGTAIMNRTIDGLLEAARLCRTVAVLGASTPLVPEAFRGTPVSLLSGVVVERPEEVLRTVSEGGGMRQFKGHVRKVNVEVAGSPGREPDVRSR